MTIQNKLVQTVIEGIQEKKGRDIAVVDMQHIITAPSKYFVICTVNSPQHAEAVMDSVEEFARKKAGEKPAAIAGRQNAIWIAMDYGTVMVHIFVPDAREYYDIDHLWDDAEITLIPNLD